MSPHESPIVHIIRSVTLLAILIAVPGIAIFWNHLPKNIMNNSAHTESNEAQKYHENSIESTTSSLSPIVVSESPIQQVSWEHAQLEQRLRELGATRLEIQPLGNQGGIYRFSCHVPLSATSSSTKTFQVNDTDPIAAKRRVIADIEKWKNISSN